MQTSIFLRFGALSRNSIEGFQTSQNCGRFSRPDREPSILNISLH